jgi:hypothetical protein
MLLMKELTYRQDPRLGREIFILRDDMLIISLKSMGLANERVIEINDISPNCELGRRRFAPLFMVPIILGIIAALATKKLVELAAPLQYLGILTFFLIPAFIWRACRELTPSEVMRFKDKKGAILFELYRPRRSTLASLAYDDFIAVLMKKITAKEPHS